MRVENAGERINSFWYSAINGLGIKSASRSLWIRQRNTYPSGEVTSMNRLVRIDVDVVSSTLIDTDAPLHFPGRDFAMWQKKAIFISWMARKSSGHLAELSNSITMSRVGLNRVISMAFVA
jgi:hypothetical protein